MIDSECEYLERLRDYASATRKFLSNPWKGARECAVCRAFLRLSGTPFKEEELIAPTTEPVDVAFRDARFQIRDLRENKPGRDWKERQERYANAISINDIKEPYLPPRPIDLGALLSRVEAALSAKAKRYGIGCKAIDALIYIDLQGEFLLPRSPIGNIDFLRFQGWRSVSLLFPPWSVVLFTTPTAPAFLREAEGRVAMNWQDIDALFEK